MTNTNVTKKFKMTLTSKYAMAMSNFEAGKDWGLDMQYETVQTENGADLYITITGMEGKIDYLVEHGHLALDFCMMNGFCSKDGDDFIDIAHEFDIVELP